MNECYFADFTIGEDAYKNFYAVCAPLGHRTIIVGGKTALEKSLDKLIPALSGFEVTDTVIYGNECTRERVAELYNTYSDKGIDFIIGVGGGKALDTSKCLADMLGVRVITVPTIASTCAASSALAVMYNEKHNYQGFWHFKAPAYHCFIDTEIIVNAPAKYFRAGIGDTLAKYYEVEFSARNRSRTYNDEMGLSISRMCGEPLMQCAEKALADCKMHKTSQELENAARIILISTGMVSMLINEDFNGALAHALFYGFTVIDGFEEEFLHGDVIGYTTMIQLLLDGKTEQAIQVRRLIKAMGVEATLRERNISCEREFLEPVLQSALNDPDMKIVPYEITADMIYAAIMTAEKLEDRQ